jgi:Flp pilus assembly protein TadD
MGRLDDALPQVQTAVALAPLDSRTTVALGEIYAWMGEPQKAIVQWEKALELEPIYPRLHQSLGLTLCREGMPEKTVEPLEQARVLFPDDPLIMADLAYCYATSGRRGDAERLLNELEELSKRSYVSPVSFALVHVGLDRVEETFEWLEKAYAERALLLPFISLDSPYEPLRSDPRFADLLRRMGLSATGLFAEGSRTSPVPG